VGAEGDKPATPRPAVTSLPHLPPELHNALQDRNFGEAIKLIDQLVAGKGQADVDYLLYLKGIAQISQGQLDGALDNFARLEKEFPKSEWLSRSRFGRGAALAKQRNYQAAAAIYKAESERLLSNSRRDELTGIYLEFADRFFEGEPEKGPTTRKQPDYNQALSFYAQALQLKPSRAVRQKVELRIARCHQELNQLPQAIEAYRNFLAAYTGRKVQPADRLPPALEVDATFQLGRAQLAAGQPAEARKTWQDFLTSDAAKEAGGKLIAEATYQLAHTYGVPTPATVGDLELGVAALEKFVKAFPKHELAPQAEFEIAQSYSQHGRFEQTVATLKKLIENPDYAKAKQVPAAWNLLGQSYAAQKKFTEAIDAWHAFLDKFPTDPGWSAVQHVIVDTEYAMAEEERARENYAAARKLWETFLNKYPLDGRAAYILLLFGQMEFDEAQKLVAQASRLPGVAAKDAQDEKAGETPAPQPGQGPKPDPEAANKLFAAAIADWQRLVSKYPGSEEASQGALNIGMTLENHLGKLADALEAYKKVEGKHQVQAQQRIANLVAKQLEIVTERKFRSNEKPRIKLTTRNLENVSIKAYRVDLADYFRKMHLATGVESLDIALIDPDKTWEHKVENFEKYRRTEQVVEIPVPGPGVTAITVSSDALEATTMVVVSDIDIIVKSSRNELFVFAQNLLTNKPAEGVKLLVSDGSKVFAEVATGKDGILQQKFDELKTVSDLRVFATHEGHGASSLISLQGLQFAVGLSPKGYLFSERPAYRAGQLVNLKGVVRWVTNDRYTFKAGEKYQLDVYDARGRVIHTETVALGEFGTVAAHFLLPGTAPQGAYRVHLHQPGRDQSYETSFVVHEYQLEPIQFSVDLKQKVFFRGEHVTGKFVLKYYYGTPLAGRTIQYRLGDDRLYTAETDANGEVAFDLETQRYSESQPLQLVAQFPERNLMTGDTIYLATRGFEIGVSTLRPVYIAGETFDATVAVRDPAGKPVGTALTFEVFEVTPAARGLPAGERLVQTHEAKSEEKTGQAQQTVRVEKAGRYLLRATGTDRFGNPVSGAAQLIVSGDEDRVRLRILADKHHYKVGETGKVQLHWRNAPALALITYDGAEVLGYRLVELKTGANTLDLPLDEKLAPNFDLSVAVMETDKFHEARSEFRVVRELVISLKPDKTTLKPGDTVNVDVQVTDANGKPVSAEVSLALIQKNLLSAFPEQAAAIDAFFNGGMRQVSIRATTSCVFRYAPPTRPINLFLLAEEDRKKILELESAARSATPQMVEQKMMRGGRFNKKLSDSAKTEDNVELFSDARSDQEISARIIVQNEAEELLELAETAEDAPAFGLSQSGAFYNPNDIQRAGASPTNRPAGAMGGGMGGTGVMSGKRRGFAKNSTSTDALRRKSGGGKELAGLGNMTRFSTTMSLEIRQGPLDFASDSDDDNGNGISDNVWLGLSSAANTYNPVLAPLFGFGVNNGPIQWNATDGRYQLGLESLVQQTNGTVLALNNFGEYQVVNGLSISALQEFAKDGLEIMPAMAAAETAYWNPRIVTDKDGKATLAIRLPDRSTAWKLLSKGINAEALAGQSEVELISKKDLFGEMKTPLAFTIGDKAEVLVEIHNATLKEGKIEVKFKSTIGDQTTELKKSIAVTKIGIEEVSFPVEITAGDAAQFELTVSSGELKDVSNRTASLVPYGAPVFATASGTAAQNTSLIVQHPAGMATENPQLELVIGPSVNRTLLDAVIGGSASLYERSPVNSAQLSSDIERAISDTLGGVALLKMIGATRTAETPEAQALSGKITSAVSQLVSSQRDDGGWSWAGRPASERSDRYMSSRAMWALSAARGAGFAVPQPIFDKGVQNLNTAFAAAGESDNEGKVIILQGLAAAGAADFAHANRLHRNRNALSASGLVHLALVFSKLDRQDFAKDLLALAKAKISTKPRARGAVEADEALKGCIPWMQSGVELRGLYLLALNAVEPGGAINGELADWLMAARVGSRWSPEKANGAVIVALADWFGRAKLTNEKYTLTIFANDRQVDKFTIDPAIEPSRVVQVPARMLVAGKPQRINIDIEGRGTFSYSAVLAGFVPADKLKGTTNDWHFSRHYEPALRMLDGEAIPRGFGVLTGGYTAFKNPLTQLPLGERGEVSIHLWRDRMTGAKDEQLDYLIYTEPIPAGTSILTDSIKGTFDRYEITPGAITFYLGDRPHLGGIQYSLVGYLPGKYKNVPSILRSFYQPERIAIAKDLPLDVLARGQKSKDVYKLTPQELYEFGKRLSAKRDFQGAAEHLRPLFKNFHLQDNIYREVVQLLFDAALAADDHGEIVQYFEIIKEKYPDVEVSFENILKVARAYTELGEYERSYLVYRATAEGNFMRESQIAGFLDERGEFLRSVQVMERLLREYPAESYIATATYSLSQEVYGKAAEAPTNVKLREAGVTRVDLIAASIHMLDHFLSTWATDPAADQASFALANALLDLEQYQTAIKRSSTFAQRYPDSKLLDSFWYVIGYSQFAIGQSDAALEMCRKVADFKRKDPTTGVELAAANQFQAIYIMGQVFHSLGKPAEAITEYSRVKDRFADANEAIEFFTRKEISLPEVTTVKPGAAAKVPLKFRNVTNANIKVYRIDLLKFGLLQRNLARITGINLAGIRPYHDLALALGDGKDYRDREKDLELPLKEEGAYLVVCQGENLYASGLVLVSPLALEIQEDATSGRVRVTIKDVTADKYVHNVHVKVIGSANDQFVSGQSDLRGIFVADGINGTSTVIARTDANRYAFYRGKTVLGNVPNTAAGVQPAKPAAAEPQGKDALLKNLQDQNNYFNNDNRMNYRNLLRNPTQGVKAKGAF
jgi:uncharacterized protein YfaS (alpha-2-macroglobulin family)/outer membrane protein assembly factor BamD (BamD/ComL family)